MKEEMNKLGTDVIRGKYPTDKVGHDMVIAKVVVEVLSCGHTHVVLVSPTEKSQMDTYKEVLRFIDVVTLNSYIDCVGEYRVNFTNGSSITVIYPNDKQRHYETTEIWLSDIKDYYTEEELNRIFDNIASTPSFVSKSICCYESNKATNKFR